MRFCNRGRTGFSLFARRVSLPVAAVASRVGASSRTGFVGQQHSQSSWIQLRHQDRSRGGGLILGEELALIESLEGKRGVPRNRPPIPVTHGYLGQPTVVNNVETFAAAAHIALHGSAWFR